MKKQVYLSTLLLIVLFINNAYSQWSVDPTVNNPICTQPNAQQSPEITSDGSGGTIITWSDGRNGNYDIYAQRVNSSGDALWAADGVPVCTQANVQTSPKITSDGSGGAIIVWADNRGTTYAQRINASGTPLWTTAAEGGITFSTLVNSSASITSDGSGGAIIAFLDVRNVNIDIYTQRINSSGVVQWTANGLAVCTQTDGQNYPSITSDGSSGAIVTWFDSRAGNQDIYAQRINSSGATLWTTAADGGIDICTNAIRQDDPTITEDGSGGAIITWFDSRNNTDIYAQRINSIGEVQWTANGVGVCTLTSFQFFPNISSDGSGGAIIAWADARNSAFYDVYAQRINSSGAPLWDADGVAISTLGGKATKPTISSDANGGIITWQDSRNASSDIYASSISSSGIMGGALPVELTTFTGQLVDETVELNWETATEVNNYGFQVQRQKEKDQSGYDWDEIGFVQGNGTTNSPKQYSFTDSDLPNANEVSYRLKQIDNDGSFNYSKIVTVDLTSITGVDDEIVYSFALEQNYPNPFNPSTTIQFTVPSVRRGGTSPYNTTLIVYDILGREMAVLVNQKLQSGNHEVSFNANNFSSGIYFYTIQSGAFNQTRKMILLR